MQSIQTILVPTDFSRHSERGLEYASDLARRLGARLHVLHALHAPTGLITNADWWETIRTRALDGLERARAVAEASGVKCAVTLSDEYPVVAIEQAVATLPADLVVIGSRGATGLEHALLGSVAERTIRAVTCPVITISAHAEQGL